MTWTGVIVLFAVFFFVVLFMILSRGIVSQSEAGHVEPGTPGSAPSEVRMGRKFLWAAIGSALIVGVVTLIMEFEIITIEDLSFLIPEPLRTPAPSE